MKLKIILNYIAVICFIILFIIPIIKANMVTWEFYAKYFDYMLIIFPIIFFISFSIELFIFYLGIRKEEILNHSKFIKYIFLTNLISFPLTHIIAYIPEYLIRDYTISILITLIFPIILECILLIYFFRKLYENEHINYEISNPKELVIFANIVTFLIGIIIIYMVRLDIMSY